MNKKTIFVILMVLFAATLGIVKYRTHEDKDIPKSFAASNESGVYWTCPMHPQIHQQHAGECPICHMKLVKVNNAGKTKTAENLTDDKRAPVEITKTEMGLIGIQKTAVEKMNMTVHLPIAGRIISRTSIAFQIYESDLKYIRTGQYFSGESSTASLDSISGTISAIDSIVDSTSRTVRVTGLVEKGSKDLQSETSFSGTIYFELKDRLVIPESAVLHSGSKDLVYLFTNQNNLIAKAIRLGLKSEGYYEVLSGLSEGDSISSGPNFLIDSEAKIRGASQ